MEKEVDLLVSDYNEKSVKVEGETTKDYLPEWNKLRGSFNRNLEGGPGWIFSIKKKEEILETVSKIRSGEIKPTNPVQHRCFKAVDKISKDMKELNTEQRKRVIEYIKATFYFE